MKPAALKHLWGPLVVNLRIALGACVMVFSTSIQTQNSLTSIIENKYEVAESLIKCPDEGLVW
jgi:hypothetical protein